MADKLIDGKKLGLYFKIAACSIQKLVTVACAKLKTLFIVT